MMKAIPVRVDDRPASDLGRVLVRSEAQEFDPAFGAGVLFWMTLVALAVIAAAL